MSDSYWSFVILETRLRLRILIRRLSINAPIATGCDRYLWPYGSNGWAVGIVDNDYSAV